MNQLLSRAYSLFKQKKFGASDELCEQLLQNAVVEADLYHLKGLNCLQMQKVSEAKDYFLLALAFEPLNGSVWLHVGIVEFQLQQLRYAREAFKNAIEINPNLLEAYNRLAVTEAKMGKLDDAINILELAIKINPSAEKIQRNLSSLIHYRANLTKDKV